MRPGIYQLRPDPGWGPCTTRYQFGDTLIVGARPNSPFPPYRPMPEPIRHFRPHISTRIGPIPGGGGLGGIGGAGPHYGLRIDPNVGMRANQAALDRARAADAARINETRRVAEQAHRQAMERARKDADRARDLAAQRQRDFAAQQQRNLTMRRQDENLRMHVFGRRPLVPMARPSLPKVVSEKPRSVPFQRLDPASARRVAVIDQKILDIELTFISQFDLSADPKIAKRKCFPAAMMMVNEGQPVRLTDDKYLRIMVAKGKADFVGHINSDPTQAYKALKYIDKLLSLNQRALVGVSVGFGWTKAPRTETEIPEDQVTSHYLAIYGRAYEPDGRVYYKYKDPGTNGEGLNAKFIDGKLYVDDATGILFKRGEQPTSMIDVRGDYEVSHVRVYDQINP
jgi:hypothetical protein